MYTKNPGVYDRIEQAILTGTLKPREKVTERALAELLGTSRTPVREALVRLGALGLVDLRPNGGATIRDFNPRQVEDLHAVRCILETATAPLVVARVNNEDVNRLREINGRFERACGEYNLPLMTQANHEFHMELYAIARNEFLSKMISDARVISFVVRSTGWLNPEIVRKSVQDHREMLAALERKDGTRLAEIIQEHILRPSTFYLATAGSGTRLGD